MSAAAACHRYDISDRAWPILEPRLPGGKGKVGYPASNNRRFIKPCSGCCASALPGSTCPPDYGDGSNTHRRFIRWRNQNVWAELQEALVDDPDGDLPDTGPGCGPKWFDCTP